MFNFLKRSIPLKTTTRTGKLQQKVDLQEERNELVEQPYKHEKMDSKSGTFFLLFKHYLELIIKFLSKLFGACILLFVLAYFAPLRDVLPSVYVWVDTILNCFEGLFSFLNYLFSFLGHLFSQIFS